MLAIEILPLRFPTEVGVNVAVRVVLWPAVSVIGVERPLREKPVPVAVAAEIVTLAVPEFVNVIVCVPLLPTCTFPKLKLVGLAESDPWRLDPVNEIVAGEPGALLVREMAPVAPVTAEAGEKVAVKLVLCPAFSVRGSAAKPLRPKPVPDGVAAVMVRAAFPVLLRVTLCEPVLPTATLPKFTLAGLIVNCGWACAPTPLRGIVSGDPGALLVIEMPPLKFPAEAGANFAENVVLSPGLSVRGVVTPLTLKPVPVALIAETVTAVVPEFVSVNA